MKKIISFYNNKGGVGKTTTSLMFAQLKAKENKKILCIDLDSQCNLTSQLIGSENAKSTIYDVFKDNSTIDNSIMKYYDEKIQIDFISGDIRLQLLNQELIQQAMFKNINIILKQKINEIIHLYDYILIDCPPTMDIMVSNALSTSTDIIIPLKADRYSIDGIKLLIGYIQDIKNNFNNDLKISGMFLNYYKRSKINNEFLKTLLENMDYMSSIKIHDYVAVQENTTDDKLMISSKNKNHKVINQFKDLFNDLHL